jgi:general secretion pathway protein D
VLAITPRIVRNLRQPEPSEAELWVGTEAYTRLRQVGGRVAPELVPGAAAAGGPAAPGIASASAPVAAPDAAPVAAPVVAPPKPLTLRWQPPASVKAGQPFTLALDGDFTTGLRGVNLKLQAEPGQLRLVEAKEGELWQQGGAKVSLTSSAEEATGAINAGVLRNEATVAQGSGRVLEWRLVAPKAGRVELSLVRASPIALDATRPTLALPPPLVLEVAP